MAIPEPQRSLLASKVVPSAVAHFVTWTYTHKKCDDNINQQVQGTETFITMGKKGIEELETERKLVADKGSNLNGVRVSSCLQRTSLLMKIMLGSLYFCQIVWIYGWTTRNPLA